MRPIRPKPAPGSARSRAKAGQRPPPAGAFRLSRSGAPEFGSAEAGRAPAALELVRGPGLEPRRQPGQPSEHGGAGLRAPGPLRVLREQVDGLGQGPDRSRLELELAPGLLATRGRLEPGRDLIEQLDDVRLGALDELADQGQQRPRALEGEAGSVGYRLNSAGRARARARARG